MTIRRVVSVSLGSSSRDSRYELKVIGEDVIIERRGTDGDVEAAKRLLRELDGNVDAIGLGGISLYVYSGPRRYMIREALDLVRVVQKTPIVDGGGIKNSLESELPDFIGTELGVNLADREALLVSAVDRFPLGEALARAGCRMVVGDLVFSLGVPIPLYSMRAIENLANVLLPIMTQLPLAWLYPTGKEQERQSKSTKGRELISHADVIAGDFHYIRRHLPDSLRDKIIITNTVTAEDRRILRDLGPVLLVTTSPNFAGRSFATNVIEALIVAVAHRPAESLTAQDFRDYALAMGLRPTAEWLVPADGAKAGA